MYSGVRQWWFAVVPAIVAFALALWAVGVPGPWWDELYTLSAVMRGLGRHSGEIPLLPYYGLAWLWTLGGRWTSIEWVRLLSGISIVGGSVAVAMAGRRLAGTRVGFAAGMFFVLAPGVARYGQEARVYAIAAALVAAGTWAFVEAITCSDRRWWFLYGGAMGLAVMFLPTAWAVLPAHSVILMSRREWRPQVRDWAAVWLFLTPILAIDVFLAKTLTWWHGWLATPQWSELPFGLLRIADSEYTSGAFPLLLVALAATSSAGLRWLAGLGASVLVVFAVSFVLGSWWNERSFLPLSSLLCLAAAMSLARWGWLLTGLALSLGLVVALPDQVAIRQPGARAPDVRVVAALLAAEGRAGDQLLITDEYVLPYAWDLFLWRDARAFKLVEVPTRGRYWEMGEVASCSASREWPLPGSGTLRLCG